MNTFEEKYFVHVGKHTDIGKKGGECHISTKYFCTVGSMRHDFSFSRLRKPKLCLPLKEAQECVVNE